MSSEKKWVAMFHPSMSSKVVNEFPRKISELENVYIPMSDGCRLAARIWLPDERRPLRFQPSLSISPIASETGQPRETR